MTDSAEESKDRGQEAAHKLSSAKIQKEKQVVPSPAATQTFSPSPRQHVDIEFGPGKRFGRYILLEKLGQGGMGSVYKVRHERLDKVLALKVLPVELTNKADVVARFQREMKSVGKLEHNNIVRATDGGEVDGVHYLVMEYVEGYDLAKLVATKGLCTVNNACVMLHQASQGLQYAHKSGLIHRDIKPSNLFLTKQGQVKILDLGLARLMDESQQREQSLTAMGMILGTPDFMAPEQWQDVHSADHRTDLYALGCTLFFLLTGKVPFGGDKQASWMQKMRAHSKQQPSSLRSIRSDVPQSLEDLYQKLMAKAPADRIQSAGELAQSLAAIVRELKDPNSAKPNSALLKTPAAGTGAQPANVQAEAETVSAKSTIVAPAAFSNSDSDLDFPEIPPINATAFQSFGPAQHGQGYPKRGQGSSGTFKWVMAGLAAVLLSLLGILVITITRPDGSQTVIEVPGNAQRIEISQEGQANVAIANTVPPVAPSAAQPVDFGSLLIDFDAERRAAENWLKINKGQLFLRAEDGKELGPLNAEIPSQKFSIRDAQLVGVDLSNEELEVLVGCKGLQSLRLNGNPRLKVSNLKKLGPLLDLKVLDVETCDMSDLTLDFLSAYPSLEELGLNSTSATTPRGLLLSLPRLPKLRSLFLPYTAGAVGNTGLQKVCQQCPKLESVFVPSDPEIATLLPLVECKELKRLHTFGNKLNAQDLIKIVEGTKIHDVMVDVPDQQTLALLASMKDKLRDLTLRNQNPGELKMDPLGWKGLAVLSELENLSVGDGVPLNSEFLKVVASMPKLKRMSEQYDLQPEYKANCRQYTAEDVQALHVARPDMYLRIDGKEYLPADVANSVNAPGTKKVTPVQPYMPLIKLGPPPSLPAVTLKLPAGTPMSVDALVGAPYAIRDLASWSIELEGHIGPIAALDVSPDMSQIVTLGSTDSTIRLWRVTEPSLGNLNVVCERIFLGEANGLWDVAWSPDGHTLAVTSFFGKTLSLYDVASGRRLASYVLKVGRGGRVRWSPDGRVLAVAGAGPLAIIDLSSRNVRYSEVSLSGGAGMGCSWSPNGQELATIDESATLKLWNLSSLEPTASISSPRGSISGAIDWSPDGKWIAVGGEGGRMAIVDAALRRIVYEKVEDANQVILSVAWEKPPVAGAPKPSPVPRLLITSTTGTFVWSGDLSQKLASCQGQGHSLKAAWSADNRAIVGEQIGLPRIYDATTGQIVGQIAGQVEKLSRLHEGQAVHLSTDGKRLRTIFRDELLIFDGEKGEYLKKVGKMLGNRVVASPNDEWLVVYDLGKEQDNLYLVDTASYERRKALVGHNGKLTGVNWSPDSKYLLTSGMDGSVRIWDVQQAALSKTLTHDRPVKNAIWSPDGKSIATCVDDDQIRIWSVDTGTETKKHGPLPSPSGWGAWGIAWNPKSNIVAIAPRSAMPVMLDLKTGQFHQASLDFQGSMDSVCWSPDGKQFLFGNFYELGYGMLTAKTGRHQHGVASPVQWLSDNRRCITGYSAVFPVQVLDVRRNVRLGVLYPQFEDGAWLCVGTDGNYRGSEGIESKLRIVALHKDGSQTTHTTSEFSKLYGWRNEPEKVRFVEPNTPR